jgi:hypothetical protein
LSNKNRKKLKLSGQEIQVLRKVNYLNSPGRPKATRKEILRIDMVRSKSAAFMKPVVQKKPVYRMIRNIQPMAIVKPDLNPKITNKTPQMNNKNTKPYPVNNTNTNPGKKVYKDSIPIKKAKNKRP